MKPQKEKPVYNVLQNISFLLGQIRLGHPSLLVFLALELVFSVVSPAFGIYLPKIAVDLAQSQAGLEQILVSLGGFGLLTALCMGISSSVARGQYMLYNDMRAYFQLRLLYQSLSCDYRVIESEAGQTKYQRAWNSVYFGDFSGTSVMLVACRDIAVNILCFFLYSGILASFSPLLIVLLTGLSLLSLLATRRAQVYENSRRNDQAQVERKLRYVVNTGGSVPFGKDIRLYGIENWFPKRMKQVYDRRIRINANIWGRMKLMDISNAVFLVARDIVAYGLLIRQVLAGQLSVAEFTFFIGIISGFTAWLTEMVTNFSYLRKAAIQQGYLRAYMEMDDCLMQGSGEELAPLSCPPAIEFRDVTFTYPETDRPVLEHLNLTIRPGQKIALVGANGAGKTTLVKLLTGLYRPDSGEILLGGRSIESYSQEEYFDLIGTVFQEPFLMAFSIEENIACCDEQQADHQRVCRCLQRAGLWERIERLPKGVKTPYTKELYEDGESFSGGEAQRLMLARALYKDAPVMVLDEPTAALDPLAEAQMYAQYNDLTADKTSIFISHRLSSTQFCDRVLYLEGGKIVEDGTHQQLMALGGSYAKMFAYQAYYYQKRLGERPDEQ